MLTRRTALVSSLAASGALFAQYGGFSGSARAQGAPLFRFGVIADPQFAAVAPRRTRFYANSLWKLAEALETFNQQDLAFVTTLGDIIDRHWSSYDAILPVYDRLKHPHFFVLGNHDYEVGADFLHSVHRVTGLKRAYYDFKADGHRFIVIDGNDVSLFANPPGSAKHTLAASRLEALKASGAANAQTWNGSASDEQYAFLEATFAAAERAGEKVVVLGHYPLFPADRHTMWDSERLVEMFTAQKSFQAYFCGHNHAGNYGETKGKHFVTFKGMVETATTSAFSVVEVYADRLNIIGHGVEVSRTLAV